MVHKDLLHGYGIIIANLSSSMDIRDEVQRYLRWPEPWLMTHSWPSGFPQGEGPQVQPPTAWTDYAFSQVVTHPRTNTAKCCLTSEAIDVEIELR